MLEKCILTYYKINYFHHLLYMFIIQLTPNRIIKVSQHIKAWGNWTQLINNGFLS